MQPGPVLLGDSGGSYLSTTVKTVKSIFYPLLILTLLKCPMILSAAQQDFARYRVVTHSSAIDSNQSGHLVVDGSMDTYWESSRSKDGLEFDGESLLIDLGEVVPVDRVVIHWGANHGTRFSVSLASKKSGAVSEVFKTKSGAGGEQSLKCAGVEARYVSLQIEDVLDPIRGCVIHEIEVLGEGESDRFVSPEPVSISPDAMSLNGDFWRIQSARFVGDGPSELSSVKYDDASWIPASVPGTIMGSYYDFGALPDPLYGDNMHQISDEFFSGNDFWYRSTVQFSDELKGQRLFLDFSGVNWKSEVYFNGSRVGKIDGAFHRGEFEVTDLVRFGEENTVAVLVRHPDNWVSGEFKVLKKTLGARTTNGDMLGLDGPASLASAGWNWLPIIRGRNIGIWNNVTFRASGDVSVVDPWVTTEVSLPDLEKAELTVRTEVKNHSSETVSGIVKATVAGSSVSQSVVLLPNETKSVEFDPSEYSELVVQNPELWWPNGYGDQPLHELNVQFVVAGSVSDSEDVTFGIRQLDPRVEDGVLFFYCNGTRLLLRGGNWGLPEAMMRCDSEGYDLRVRLHRDANFNMIRNWVGMTPHAELYEACDKYGVLIFDDFWLANPKNGPDPRDFSLFMSNVKDKIKWVRKHASLALYCGRNEGIPPLAYDIAMAEETERLDGTRVYIPDSAGGVASGYGPYDVRSPEWYFEKRGATLHSEQGIIAIPEIESFRRMMPEEDLWPISDMWAVHNYQQGRSEKYTATLTKRFGESKSIEEYSSRAQLYNYESAKAMFECLQDKQGSGMLLWMSQSAWPSLICQLYDHYFEYTASFFASKKASSPVHVFWNSELDQIRIANNTTSDLDKVSVTATIYAEDGSTLWKKSRKMSVASASAETCFPLKRGVTDKVSYLKLEMVKDGSMIADNFYWIQNSDGDCLELNDLPMADISIDVEGSYAAGLYHAKITLKNESGSISLLNKIKVKDGRTGESILPVFLDDSYVSLLPGEERVLNLEVDASFLKGRDVEIHLEGWNTKTLTTKLAKEAAAKSYTALDSASLVN